MCNNPCVLGATETSKLQSVNALLVCLLKRFGHVGGQKDRSMKQVIFLVYHFPLEYRGGLCKHAITGSLSEEGFCALNHTCTKLSKSCSLESTEDSMLKSGSLDLFTCPGYLQILLVTILVHSI